MEPNPESSWFFYLLLVFLCIFFQGSYAMMEMAAVSFNKVRLQYYVSRKNQRALWLGFLLKHPAQLFGTTLIGVNTALQVGSECSRRFYDALGLSPDWAPLSQVVIVLVFAEIAPIFAARRFAEYVAMKGIPFLYGSSIVLRPIVWVLERVWQVTSSFFGGASESVLSLSREELQNILEEREEVRLEQDRQEFNTVVTHIFSLKTKTAHDLMLPVKEATMLPSVCTIGEMRSLLRHQYHAYLPIYHRSPQNIVAIAYPRDLLRISEEQRVREHARPAWFITEEQPILQILKQFRYNNQTVAVVLNQAGLAIGILTLDTITDEIFGYAAKGGNKGENKDLGCGQKVLVDRSFSGELGLEEFNRQFHADLHYQGAKTLSELMALALGHIPAKGESVKIGSFELTVEESSLLGAKVIAVRTLYADPF